MTFFAQSASPLSANALVRYLILLAACQKKRDTAEDPNGEFLE